MKHYQHLFTAIIALLFSFSAFVSCSKEELDTVPDDPAGPTDSVESEDLYLRISPDTDTVVFDAAYPVEVTYEVSTNAESWNAVSDSDWLTVKKDDGMFILTAVPNVLSEDSREAIVTLTVNDSICKNVTVTQNTLKIYVGGNEVNPATGGTLGKYWHNGEGVTVGDMSALSAVYLSRDGSLHLAGGASFGGAYWSEKTGLFNVLTHTFPEESTAGIYDIEIDESTGDVYLACSEGWPVTTEEGYTQTYVSYYWKNFTEFNVLTSDGPGCVALPYDIEVVENKIYVLIDDDGVKSYYLADGVETVIEEVGGGSSVSCMVVHGNDVYVGGYYLEEDRFCPCYWINGKANPIPTDVNSQIYCIAVDNNGDVYLGGSEGAGLDRAAAYWKNGEKTVLSDYNNGVLCNIFAIDGNVLAFGSVRNDTRRTVVRQWINGESTDLSDGTLNAWAECAFIR